MSTETLDLTLSWERDGGVYTMPGSCANCGWRGTLVLSRGSEAPKHHPYYKAARCRNCGCKTVGAIR